ncbi:MAG: methyltransferase [Ilumatobacteraceae bacterium]|nr:methyltransferase [Ilumatobacteraceae bacterium]
MIAPGASVLDLGAGVGRLANPLSGAGHRVVAVDNDARMLEHVDGARPVLADIWTPDLGDRFGAVLALSHLVNDVSRERRLGLLDVCRRHLDADGVLIVQRYVPGWVPTDSTSIIGSLTIRLHDITLHPGRFEASVTYSLDDRSWTQVFDGCDVGDTELERLAAATGLRVVGTLDDAGAWVRLAPVVQTGDSMPS